MRKYGWHREAPSNAYLLLPKAGDVVLPAQFSLRSKCAPVYDQGDLGSCTANSIAGVLEMKHGVGVTPSRLMIYWNERWLDGHRNVYADTGSTITQSVNAIVHWGWAPETEWPYNIRLFMQRPPISCYTNARPHKITQYAAVQQDANSIKQEVLAGDPVLFGFDVFQQFEDVGSDGVIAMPSGQSIGGHAIHIVGWDDAKQMFEVRNSWGASWGDAGYGWMPYAYMLSENASDFRVVRVAP